MALLFAFSSCVCLTGASHQFSLLLSQFVLHHPLGVFSLLHGSQTDLTFDTSLHTFVKFRIQAH